MNHAELLKKWEFDIKQADHIFSWTEPLTFAYLAEQASKSKFAVEHGVYMGATSFVMLKANPHLHLWACDPFMVAGTEKVTRYHLRDQISGGRCEVIPKGSTEASAQLAHMAGKIDLVFVDDGHAKEDVMLDIQCWLPLLRSGGLLCGHDFDSNPFNNVAEGVIASLPNYELPVPRLWAYVKP